MEEENNIKDNFDVNMRSKEIYKSIAIPAIQNAKEAEKKKSSEKSTREFFGDETYEHLNIERPKIKKAENEEVNR